MIRKQTYRQAHRCLLLWKSKVGDDDQKVIKELLIYNFREIKIFQFSSIQFSPSVVSASFQPHGLQHARPPCPSPTSGACSSSCLLCQWCHPTVSSSVVPFSRLQSFPASGSFQMCWFFTLGEKILEFQLQHQSFQWIFRTDFL